MGCVRALHDDPNVDLLLLAEELPREAGIERKVSNLTTLDRLGGRQEATKPVALFSPVSLRETAYMRELRDRLTTVADAARHRQELPRDRQDRRAAGLAIEPPPLVERINGSLSSNLGGSGRPSIPGRRL